MKTKTIIFSKNRTLQLKSLLLSLRYYSDAPEENITIIYKADEGIDYSPLFEQFPKCEFRKQSSFLEDIRDIVMQNISDYVWFMVDDLIYRENFSLSLIENFMDTNPDVDAFCLRLGRNIKKGKQPNLISRGNGILVWDTDKTLGKYWNYFWELCSSIYRRELVLKYLKKCRPEKETFPNPFEFHYYACMPNTRATDLLSFYIALRFPFSKKSNRIACFENSKCFIHGINLVAELNDNREETYSVIDLHKKMLDGYIIDFKNNIVPELDTPSPGHKFCKIVKE